MKDPPTGLRIVEAGPDRYPPRLVAPELRGDVTAIASDPRSAALLVALNRPQHLD